MEPVILFRRSRENEQEVQIASKYFDVVFQRNGIRNKFVIGRYSTLPFYKELEEDLRINNSVLVDTYEQFKWIANFEYYNALKEFTFPTWFDYSFPEVEAPFVVKGVTNSRKFEWNSKMFALDKRAAINIAAELQQDGLIGDQQIIIRKYLPLKTFEVGINGLPFTNEWRFFFYKKTMLSHGFYWSCAEDAEKRTIDGVGLLFAQKIANIVCDHSNFFVIDIAERENGEWILVELNHGTMSGLSLNNPDIFYANLRKSVDS